MKWNLMKICCSVRAKAFCGKHPFRWSFNQGGTQDTRLLVTSYGRDRESMQPSLKTHDFSLQTSNFRKSLKRFWFCSHANWKQCQHHKSSHERELLSSIKDAQKSCTWIITSAVRSSSTEHPIKVIRAQKLVAGVARGSDMATGSSLLLIHCLGNGNQQERMLSDERFRKKSLSIPAKRK